LFFFLHDKYVSHNIRKARIRLKIEIEIGLEFKNQKKENQSQVL